MLSQKVFKQSLKELEDCFDNFNFSENKLKAWYKYSKDIEDQQWQVKISNCIKGCHRIPTLADILDLKEYYCNTGDKELRERAIACRKRNPGCYQKDGSPACAYC